MKISNGPCNETRFNRDIIKTYKFQTFRMHSKQRKYFYSPEQQTCPLMDYLLFSFQDFNFVEE